MRRFLAAILAVSTISCSDNDEPSRPPTHEAVNYELVDQAYTTLQQLWEPLLPSAATQALIDDESLKVTDIDDFAAQGLGVRLAEGLDWVEHRELAPDFTSGTEGERRSVLYLWQSADPQIIDEESPIRFEGFDGLYRPQGHLIPQVFEAHVRTAERLSTMSGRPFDFALIAGDLTDGSQANELDWMFSILNGGSIDPDSGVDDDPLAGPGNDYNDPFLSVGLNAPWYAAIGNHETLYNGGFGTIDDELEAASMGSEIYQFPLFTNGFRDGSTLHADVVIEGSTPADSRRKILRHEAVLNALYEADGLPTGHGLSAEGIAAGVAYFSVRPMSELPIRLITLNTVYPEPKTIGVGTLGWVDLAQHEWLKTELSNADAAHELIVVMSHHRISDLAEDSPVSAEELTTTLTASEGVILHLTGHGHENEKDSFGESSASSSGHWELMLASTVDFPMQSRIIEVIDERNGYLSIYVTNLDHNSPTDSLAHRGRELAAAKRAFGDVTTTGDIANFWADDITAQNLLLRVKISDALRDELAKHAFSTRIESEATLQALSTP